jgi:hypothetical protein
MVRRMTTDRIIPVRFSLGFLIWKDGGRETVVPDVGLAPDGSNSAAVEFQGELWTLYFQTRPDDGSRGRNNHGVNKLARSLSKLANAIEWEGNPPRDSDPVGDAWLFRDIVYEWPGMELPEHLAEEWGAFGFDPVAHLSAEGWTPPRCYVARYGAPPLLVAETVSDLLTLKMALPAP